MRQVQKSRLLKIVAIQRRAQPRQGILALLRLGALRSRPARRDQRGEQHPDPEAKNPVGATDVLSGIYR